MTLEELYESRPSWITRFLLKFIKKKEITSLFKKSELAYYKKLFGKVYVERTSTKEEKFQNGSISGKDET